MAWTNNGGGARKRGLYLKPKTYQGKTQQVGSVNLYADKTANPTGILTIAGKSFFVTFVPYEGEDRRGRRTAGFLKLTLREGQGRSGGGVVV